MRTSVWSWVRRAGSRSTSRRQELQRDRLAELQVVGAIDLAHPALAQRGRRCGSGRRGACRARSGRDRCRWSTRAASRGHAASRPVCSMGACAGESANLVRSRHRPRRRSEPRLVAAAGAARAGAVRAMREVAHSGRWAREDCSRVRGAAVGAAAGRGSASSGTFRAIGDLREVARRVRTATAERLCRTSSYVVDAASTADCRPSDWLSTATPTRRLTTRRLQVFDILGLASLMAQLDPLQIPNRSLFRQPEVCEIAQDSARMCCGRGKRSSRISASRRRRAARASTGGRTSSGCCGSSTCCSSRG